MQRVIDDEEKAYTNAYAWDSFGVRKELARVQYTAYTICHALPCIHLEGSHVLMVESCEVWILRPELWVNQILNFDLPDK